MALTGSGTISMSDMRTEFGISGAISMSDLYRGGSEVPANATVTGSLANAETTANTTSFDGFFSGQGSGHYASQALLTLAMTVGGNGDAAASGNMVFQGNASGSGDNASLVTVTSGGVKVVSANASGLDSGGGISSGTVYKTISGTTTSASISAATHVTTITSGTSLDIPSDVTSFKFIHHMTVFKKERSSDGDGSATAQLGARSGSYTSTGAVNTNVPASGTIAFSDLYGAIA